MSSSTSSKRRSIQEFQPKVSIDDQIAAIDDLTGKLKESVKNNYDSDNTASIVKLSNDIKMATIGLLQTNWNYLRSAARQNDTDEIESCQSLFEGRMDSFQLTATNIQNRAFNYLKKACKSFAFQQEDSGSIEILLNTCQDLIYSYLDLADKYINSAEKIRQKSLVRKLKEAKYNFAEKMNKSAIKSLISVFNFCTETYSQPMEEEQSKILDEIVSKFTVYFFDQSCQLRKSYDLLSAYYPLQHVYTGNATDNEEMIEKYHGKREDMFNQLLELIKVQIESFDNFIGQIQPTENVEEDEEDEEDSEEKKEANAKRLVFEFQTNTINSFFMVIYTELKDLMLLTSQASENEQVYQASENLMKLFRDIQQTKADFPTYEQYIDFYTTSIKANDTATATDLEQDLLDTLDMKFDDLVSCLDNEKNLPDVIREKVAQESGDQEIDNQKVAAEISENSPKLRQAISYTTRELINTLSAASKVFFTKYQPQGNEEEENDEEKSDNQEEEEQEEQINHFSDFLDYLNELMHNHLKDMRLLETELEDDSKKLTGKTNRRTDDSRSSFSRATATEEGRSVARSSKSKISKSDESNPAVKDAIRRHVEESVVGTTSDLIEILRIKVIESVRVYDFKKALEYSQELPSLVAQNGKILSEMRRKAALEVNIQRVKEIDQMIQGNDIDQRAEIVTCIDQAFQDVIDQVLTNYESKKHEFIDKKDQSLVEHYKSVEMSFNTKMNTVHIKELTNLEKKYIIEKEQLKNKVFPEVESLKQMAAKLTQQGEYDQAQIKVNEMMKMKKKLLKQNEYEIDRKHNQRVKKLEEKQCQELKVLEEESERELERINNEFEENIRVLKLTLKSTIKASVSDYALTALKLMATNNTTKESPSKISAKSLSDKSPTKDSQSRKQMIMRLENIAKDVIKQYQANGSDNLEDL